MREDDPRNSPDWLPDEAVEALNMDRSFHPEESLAETARRIYHENAPAAATSVVHIALYGSNERVRLAAAMYVTDRVLGRVGEDVNVGKDSPLDLMIKNMQKAAEVHANN
jgi:hypothetical protein